MAVRRGAKLGRWGLLIPLLAGCGASLATGGPCSQGVSRPLPPEVPESSGVAVSRVHDGVYWTHNDSGWEPELFAVDEDGARLATVQVDGAENRDWEDLAIGPCDGQESCLYIADTGDNRLVRDTLVIYRVPEPPLEDGAEVAADSLPLVLPDGPRDIEAVFFLPGAPSDAGRPTEGSLHLVTKGRGGPIKQYRYEGPFRAGETAEVEKVARLSDRRPLLPRMVTGAAATSDGRRVAVRTYESLHFFRPQASGALPRDPLATVNLKPLGEPQGEAVAFGPGDQMVLTSEAGPGGDRGVLTHLRCRPE